MLRSKTMGEQFFSSSVEWSFLSLFDSKLYEMTTCARFKVQLGFGRYIHRTHSLDD